MPSTARNAFDANRKDIDRLLEIHADITPKGPGRKWQVDALHKASIVLLSAFWEAFCEDLAAEGLEHLVTHGADAQVLPEPLRRRVSKELDPKNQLAAWDLADGGWRTLLRTRLANLQTERNQRLNTPKTWNIKMLFGDAIGIEDVPDHWSWPGMSAVKAEQKLDALVTLRGDIAHRGSSVTAPTKPKVKTYYAHVQKLVETTEAYVGAELDKATGVPLWT
ncbi:HEPN domain-containing protein [Streptomyces sp. GXMU-J15]|uniref:HEPN domain-containing protein n=1 Tax=Streptomyces fuscus TaxID=3048495 RepID=A0ABT7J9P2_9ACTN|nr:HEPN domain-containing protein [Streptomyces fuscus]MDL2081601.1 HEPN domain-containing protein [Streptomyces fuscus]